MMVANNFLLIINQTEFCLAYNQKENYHYDHNHFNLKGICKRFLRVNLSFSVFNSSCLQTPGVACKQRRILTLHCYNLICYLNESMFIV